MSNNAKKYQVGYGRPPEATRFKPGQSGNPKGRPRGAQNFSTIVRKELAQEIEVIENGRSIRLSKKLLTVKAQVAKAAKGDSKAAELLIKLDQQAELREQQQAGEITLPESDLAILDRVLARRMPSKGGFDDQS